HYDGLWRFLRRLGVPASEVEDAAQKVVIVLAERIATIERGKEKSFLFSTALRVASDARRKNARSREELAKGDALPEASDGSPGADDQLDARRRLVLLDRVLATLSDELREVLVLVDLEEETMAAASETLGIPPGTVASRLRRARETFEKEAEKLKTTLEGEGR
ncbi:MAG TPA: RNA polymerase sigma factor, partial [Polyangiaceae bacterium]